MSIANFYKYSQTPLNHHAGLPNCDIKTRSQFVYKIISQLYNVPIHCFSPCKHNHTPLTCSSQERKDLKAVDTILELQVERNKQPRPRTQSLHHSCSVYVVVCVCVCVCGRRGLVAQEYKVETLSIDFTRQLVTGALTDIKFTFSQ